jgi:hypothetical protein
LKPAGANGSHFEFLAGAWLGLVTWWLENDMPHTEEEMALMFQKLILYGTADVGSPPQG